MAKTQDIKRRIKSISNTRQLTSAMKMVSAAKLRRAQERIFAARPYSERTVAILRSLSARSDGEIHPLLAVHGDTNTDLVVVTADKGLCGGFNATIIREAEAYIRRHPREEINVAVVGKKARDYFRRLGRPLERQWVDVFKEVTFAQASQIAATLIDRYLTRQADKIVLVYNEFKSAIQATPVAQQLLPVKPMELAPGEYAEDYLYEPAPEKLFATLLPHYVEIQVYHALLESAAAEHAARMTAMDSATSNAGELIESLTLTMNRVRQASITTEIIEVVSGAQALG